jgi:hypothetical protein
MAERSDTAAAADVPRKIAASYCDEQYAEEAEQQIRALVKWYVARALEEAAALCEARADAGVASGSWDGGISAWDAAQILAAAIRGMVRT